MQQPAKTAGELGHRYALCVGISTYINLENRNLRFAIDDATDIAERLADPQRGNFDATLLQKPIETTKAAIDEAVERLLSAPDRQAEDLALLYFSCHGDLNKADGTFYLLPSDATNKVNGIFDPTTVIGISDLARWFSRARTHNIVLLLDVCHSGGAGIALQQFNPHLEVGPNYYILGAARQDQITEQSSRLKHGVFTYCFLRACEQPPTKDGWLTISQIHTFVSDEISWFAKEPPTQIQSWSVAVDPNLPLLRNPGYPELCPLPPLWNVPLPRNNYFTGQDDLLVRLAYMLRNEQKTALTQPNALSGLGGIGKTQLALEYAYRHRQDYHAVLWGRADTHEALISTFVSIAHLLDLPQKDEPDQMAIVEAVKAWLKNRTQWLFILDNADDLTSVIDFLPPAFRGHLLLTTRAQTMGKIIGNKLEMEVMRPEVGALLLLRRARIVTAEASLEKAPEEVVAQAIKLAKDLGGLPLALDQAGAYIEETQCGILDYQRQYQIRRAELLARRGGLKDDHPEPVFTTWSLSFAKVEATNPMSAKLLQICAFLAPDAIPEKLLVEALKNPQHASRKTEQENEEGVWFSSIASGQLDEAMAVLLAYSLVQRNPQEKTLSVHRLVQAVLRDSMEVKIAKYWKQQMVLVVSKAFPSLKDVRQWDICEQWLPHALMCITWIEQEQMITEEAEHLLSAIGLYLDVRARYREAESLLEYAHSIQEQRFGSEHPYTADSLNNLAFLYHHQGRYTEAEPLYLRALKIYEQRLGPEHPATILCLNNLAMLYQDQGKYIEAQRLLKQVVMITEQLLGREHPVMARGLNNLAMVYYHQGRYTKAEPLYLRALKIYEHRLGPEHPDTSLCLNNLATLYRAQRKYAEAELLLERALSIQEQQLGPEHPDTANALNNLAIVYQDQRKYAEAELLLERALSIREQQLGPEHPETATTLNNLALLYAEQGKYTQAEPLYQRALATLERQLGPEHPNTQGALKNYTTLLHNLKRTKRSRNKWLRRF